MRFEATQRLAFVLSSTISMTSGLMAQSAPPGPAARPAPRPVVAVATTFDAVHDGKHVAGKAVDFPVVLLPETAIRNKSGATTTYTVLAVRKDGAYLKSLEALVVELKGPGAEMMREIPNAVGEVKRYKPLMDGLDALLKRAFDAQPAPEETVAVEVPGFETVASAYDWEKVDDPNAQPFRFNPITPYRGELFAIDAPGIRRDIINLALAQPPKVDQPLPAMNLSPLFKFKNQVDLDNFNAAVDLFNAELRRRRGYIVERTQADLQLALDRLETRLGQGEETLSATVIPSPPLAKETFSRIYKGKVPAAFVRERGKPAATLMRRALATTAVQVCSYPSGASVQLDGREVGVTPYLERSLPAASKLKVVVSAAGLPPHEIVETVPMRPSGTKRFEYNLVTTKPRLLSDDEGKRLFDPAFKPGQPFTLAITWSPYTPPPREKKETKEQQKDREVREHVGGKLAGYVDAMKKTTSDPASPLASWFRLVEGRDADVMVEIVAILPAETKSKYDTHRLRVRLAGDPPGGGFAEDLAPSIAKPSAPLEAATQRLRNERWPRALGIE